RQDAGGGDFCLILGHDKSALLVETEPKTPMCIRQFPGLSLYLQGLGSTFSHTAASGAWLERYDIQVLSSICLLTMGVCLKLQAFP
ncbi:hypothetical protein, partial [Pseudomonas syringae]|uniref:hypothetical protein n=1 Tax=Pseudomonas syringae TaxID=317 RepID=UPI0019D357B5